MRSGSPLAGIFSGSVDQAPPALSPSHLNAGLKDMFHSVCAGRGEEMKHENIEVSAVSWQNKQLILMPSAHDLVHAQDIVHGNSAEEALPLADILAKIPRDNLDHLTCIIPLAELNISRMHWVLLVLHNGMWFFFDSKQEFPRAYKLDSIRKIINEQGDLPSFPQKQKFESVMDQEPDNVTLYYTNEQEIFNHTDSGYFAAHYAEYFISCFLKQKLDRYQSLDKHSVRSNFFYHGYHLKIFDIASNESSYETMADKLTAIQNEIVSDVNLTVGHKEKLRRFAALCMPSPELLSQIEQDRINDMNEEKEYIQFLHEIEEGVEAGAREPEMPMSLEEYFSKIEQSIIAVDSLHCAEAKKHCQAVLQEIRSLDEDRPEDMMKKINDCHELLQITTLLQDPDADRFQADVLQHANALLLHEPSQSRTSGWIKLGYALLGVGGVALMAAGVVLVCSGIGIGPLLMKTGAEAIITSVTGCLSMVAGAAYTFYGQDRFFAKTPREQLQREVAKIQAVPVMGVAT